jgi:hypothetical protein
MARVLSYIASSIKSSLQSLIVWDSAMSLLGLPYLFGVASFGSQ